MFLHFLDNFVRKLALWLVLLLLLPVVGAYLMTSTATYTARASLWVEQPLFTEQGNGNQGYTWESPAKQVSSLFNELLQTRDFISGIIDNTSRKNTIKNDTELLNVIDYISTKTKVAGDGFRLIAISYVDTRQDRAIETLQVIVNHFQDYYSSRITQQGDNAVAYYQKQVNSAKDDLDKATERLKAFIQAHPSQIGKDTTAKAVSPEDLEYNNLLQNQTIARTRFDEASANLNKINQEYSAYKEGRTTLLRVQDKPLVSDADNTKFRQLLIGVGGGIGIALVLSVALSLLFAMLDRTVRYGFHAQQVLGTESVLEVPNYVPVKPGSKKKELALAQPRFVEGRRSRSRRKLKAGQPPAPQLRQTIACSIIQSPE